MMELKRLPGWRQRLAALIEGLRRTPFAWGTNDCGPALAGEAVKALTGADLAKPWRGAYASAEEAQALLAKAGHEDLADLVATLLPEIHPSLAKVGDIAAIPVKTPFRHALGVVNGGGTIMVLRPEGLGSVGLLTADRAFRVG